MVPGEIEKSSSEATKAYIQLLVHSIEMKVNGK